MVEQQQTQVPAETRALKPANGQVLNDINEALNAVVDLKGEKIDFKRNEDIKDDLVYTGEGSDGNSYTIQLQKKSVIVSVYVTPKPSEGVKISKSKRAGGTSAPKPTTKEEKKDSSSKKDLDNIVQKLDKPLLNKDEKKKY